MLRQCANPGCETLIIPRPDAPPLCLDCQARIEFDGLRQRVLDGKQGDWPRIMRHLPTNRQPGNFAREADEIAARHWWEPEGSY